VAAVVGIVELIRRAPGPEPALPGWKAALVPVAVPSVAGTALVILAIGAYADRGLALLGAALAGGVLVLTLLAPFTPPEGAGRRAVVWAARVLSATLVVAGVLLVIDGVFDV
jgi:small neutral amino acid transporter SnatA (MarC family)